MVEYKKVAGQADPVLMEINGRPWGSIALPIASGVDYPRYLIDWCLTGALPPKDQSYRAGSHLPPDGWRTHSSQQPSRGETRELAASVSKFLEQLVRVAVPWYPGMHYDDLWLSDPKPGLAGLVNWFRVRIGKRSRPGLISSMEGGNTSAAKFRTQVCSVR